MQLMLLEIPLRLLTPAMAVAEQSGAGRGFPAQPHGGERRCGCRRAGALSHRCKAAAWWPQVFWMLCGHCRTGDGPSGAGGLLLQSPTSVSFAGPGLFILVLLSTGLSHLQHRAGARSVQDESGCCYLHCISSLMVLGAARARWEEPSLLAEELVPSPCIQPAPWDGH